VLEQRDEVSAVRHEQASLGPSPERARRRELARNRKLGDPIALNAECRLAYDEEPIEAISANRREGPVEIVTLRSVDFDRENGRPNAGAAVWTVFTCGAVLALDGFHRTPTREADGTSCLRSSNLFGIRSE
jgi:hypothetical protein